MSVFFRARSPSMRVIMHKLRYVAHGTCAILLLAIPMEATAFPLERVLPIRIELSSVVAAHALAASAIAYYESCFMLNVKHAHVIVSAFALVSVAMLLGRAELLLTTIVSYTAATSAGALASIGGDMRAISLFCASTSTACVQAACAHFQGRLVGEELAVAVLSLAALSASSMSLNMFDCFLSFAHVCMTVSLCALSVFRAINA